MCMVLAHTTTASGVCNYYNLPNVDDAEANVSAHVGNVEEIYEANYFGMEKDEG